MAASKPIFRGALLLLFGLGIVSADTICVSNSSPPSGDICGIKGYLDNQSGFTGPPSTQGSSTDCAVACAEYDGCQSFTFATNGACILLTAEIAHDFIVDQNSLITAFDQSCFVCSSVSTTTTTSTTTSSTTTSSNTVSITSEATSTTTTSASCVSSPTCSIVPLVNGDFTSGSSYNGYGYTIYPDSSGVNGYVTISGSSQGLPPVGTVTQTMLSLCEGVVYKISGLYQVNLRAGNAISRAYFSIQVGDTTLFNELETSSDSIYRSFPDDLTFVATSRSATIMFTIVYGPDHGAYSYYYSANLAHLSVVAQNGPSFPTICPSSTTSLSSTTTTESSTSTLASIMSTTTDALSSSTTTNSETLTTTTSGPSTSNTSAGGVCLVCTNNPCLSSVLAATTTTVRADCSNILSGLETAVPQLPSYFRGCTDNNGAINYATITSACTCLAAITGSAATTTTTTTAVVLGPYQV